jgi:hypothetical protein
VGVRSTFSVKMPGEMDDVPSVTEMDSDNPCWEDFYDDDCAMSNIAAAAFVAGEWIKSLPCAKGLEVSLPVSVCFAFQESVYFAMQSIPNDTFSLVISGLHARGS